MKKQLKVLKGTSWYTQDFSSATSDCYKKLRAGAVV